MKKVLFLTLTICASKNVFSQKDFRSGFIIKNTGDTLTGFINYQGGANVYKQCTYKDASSHSTVTYAPSEIRGYGFTNDKFFQSKEVPVDIQSFERAFIEVITRGVISLYKYDELYFLEKNNAGPQLLTNRVEEVTIQNEFGTRNTQTVTRESKRHLATINMLMSDCQEIRIEQPDINLSERALTKLVEKYNRCVGSTFVSYKASKPWAKTSVGLIAGVNFSNIDFDEETNFYPQLQGSFETAISPVISFLIEVSAPRISERVAVNLEAAYLSSTYNNYRVVETGHSTMKYSTTIKLQQLKIPVGIRYTFPERKFTPYFDLGIASTIHLKSNSVLEFEGGVNPHTPPNNEAFEIMSNTQFGLWSGFGVKKLISRKLCAFIGFRFERTNGIVERTLTGNTTLRSHITNLQIQVGIRTR